MKEVPILLSRDEWLKAHERFKRSLDHSTWRFRIISLFRLPSLEPYKQHLVDGFGIGTLPLPGAVFDSDKLRAYDVTVTPSVQVESPGLEILGTTDSRMMDMPLIAESSCWGMKKLQLDIFAGVCVESGDEES